MDNIGQWLLDALRGIKWPGMANKKMGVAIPHRRWYPIWLDTPRAVISAFLSHAVGYCLCVYACIWIVLWEETREGRRQSRTIFDVVGEKIASMHRVFVEKSLK